jgi:hypothetical protein
MKKYAIVSPLSGASFYQNYYLLKFHHTPEIWEYVAWKSASSDAWFLYSNFIPKPNAKLTTAFNYHKAYYDWNFITEEEAFVELL